MISPPRPLSFAATILGQVGRVVRVGSHQPWRSCTVAFQVFLCSIGKNTATIEDNIYRLVFSSVCGVIGHTQDWSVVADASTSVQLYANVNLFSSLRGPQVADTAPHVPALHSSGPPQSVSLSDPGISSCTKSATHPPLFSPSPSLPPADRLVCTHTPPFSPCWLFSQKMYPGIRGRGSHVRFSSPWDSAAQWVRTPSISPGVDVGLWKKRGRLGRSVLLL